MFAAQTFPAFQLFMLCADHSCISFAHADLIVVDTQVTTDCSIELDCQFVRRTEQEEPFAIVELPELL